MDSTTCDRPVGYRIAEPFAAESVLFAAPLVQERCADWRSSGFATLEFRRVRLRGREPIRLWVDDDAHG